MVCSSVYCGVAIIGKLPESPRKLPESHPDDSGSPLALPILGSCRLLFQLATPTPNSIKLLLFGTAERMGILSEHTLA